MLAVDAMSLYAFRLMASLTRVLQQLQMGFPKRANPGFSADQPQNSWEGERNSWSTISLTSFLYRSRWACS